MTAFIGAAMALCALLSFLVTMAHLRSLSAPEALLSSGASGLAFGIGLWGVTIGAGLW